MVVTTNKDFKITRGDTPTKVFNVTVGSAGTNYNMTGSTVILTIKKSPTDASALHQITGTPGDGSVSFDFTTTHTGIVGSYVYDIQETTSGSKVNTLVTGQLSITPDVNN